MERDIAVVLNREVEAGKLTEAAARDGGRAVGVDPHLRYLHRREAGRGQEERCVLPVYRHAERTLTDEEVAELHGKVVAKLEQSFAAELRK